MKTKTNTMQTLLLFLFSILFSTPDTSAQNISQSTWNDYTGSHYGTQPWGGWVRDYSRSTGNYILDSGSVYGQIDTNLINSLYNTMLTLPTQYDVTLQTGGLGSARDTQRVNLYLSRIEADSGATWRELCKKEAIKLASLPDGKNRIFWQVGNEISSPAYSEQLNLWVGNPVPCGTGCGYDQFVIPIYAEYYLAPSVQGFNEASMQLFGSPDSINIMLGSLTNAGGNGASLWLDSLLNYTIIGTYAPALAGKKVYELVDIISIHYMMGTQSTSLWKSKIDNYRNDWFGVGRIKGIWSTEEVGIGAATGGRGAAVGAAVTARYLEWALINNYTPYQCRTNYYANGSGPANTTVNDLNQEIYNFLGPAYISLVDSNAIIYDNPNVESHAFLSADSTKGIIYTFLKVSPPMSGSVSNIKITGFEMGNITGATSHHFSPTGHLVINPSLTSSLDTFIVDMLNPYLLDSGYQVLVTFIETQPLVSSIFESTGNNTMFIIYPNPAHDAFTLVTPAELENTSYDLIIYNSLGEQVYQEKISSSSKNIRISPSTFSSGIYNVVLKSNSSIFSQKLIIEK